MKNFSFPKWGSFFVISFFFLFCHVTPPLPDPAYAATPVYTYSIVKTYPHDPSAFTEGLFFLGGYLYESTGRYGQSSLRKIDLETGKILMRQDIPSQYFGEGITRWGDRIIMLTRQSGKGFIFDLGTFRKTGEFSYQTEGWGITFDGSQLIMSDGSSTLQFLEPGTFKIVKTLKVRDEGKPVRFLNELEYIQGEIWANIWRSKRIARISPRTGKVKSWIDLGGLDHTFDSRTAGEPNGIAYDSEQGRIFVTGKLWPRLFEIRIIEKPK
jgi:glutamine cyclotransferase